VGEKAPPEVVAEEEGSGEATVIGLVTQMSYRFPRSPLALTNMTV